MNWWSRELLSIVAANVAGIRNTLHDHTVELRKILKEMKKMAADRELLAQLAADLTALAEPVGALIASEKALRARVTELEGAAAADEAGDLEAASAVKAAYDGLAGKFVAEPDAPDVEPLPEPEPAPDA